MRKTKTIIGATILFVSMLFAQQNIFAQDNSSRVHFFVTKTNLGRGVATFELFINAKFATNIGAEEILEYKMYSKGRISVTLRLSQDMKFDGILNIDKPGDYYVVADLRLKTLKIVNVENEEWDKFIQKVKTKPSHIEEDIKNPFGKIDN